MIITKQKKPEDILKILEGKKNIFVVGCGDCAAVCKTGGEGEVAAMAQFLKDHGKEVTGMATPDVTCAAAQAKVLYAKNRDAIKSAEAVLVLACGSGVQCVKENDRFDLDVFSGCDSLFSALIDPQGGFREVCSSCGDCLLDLTGGVCPVTRCPKGILNGPCGGQDSGKCEVDKNRDCAWIMIYERLKSKGKLSNMRRRIPAKDRSKASGPRQVP